LKPAWRLDPHRRDADADAALQPAARMLNLRLCVPGPLQAGATLGLPPGAARHAQVRRVQPGDVLWLFDGSGHDWPARVLAVGRHSVDVELGDPVPGIAEPPIAVTLALGMPANERMDTLVEKAVELGVAALQPLLCERSVLRLAGERAERKREHWQAIAEAACEQSGRSQVPVVQPVVALPTWLRTLQPAAAAATSGTLRLVLSLQPQAGTLPARAAAAGPVAAVLALSGPEGGLTPAEEAAAVAAGFAPVGLGPRVLRADTAPLALLAWFGIQAPRPQTG
jgi:16S rRNA (uracil1498-N3)-methyltransferase